MSQCEQKRFDTADRDLQTTYKRVLDQVALPSKIKLRAAQAAWLVYRKAESDFQGSRAEGGTLAPLLRVTTLADLTERRSSDLRKVLKP